MDGDGIVFARPYPPPLKRPPIWQNRIKRANNPHRAPPPNPSPRPPAVTVTHRPPPQLSTRRVSFKEKEPAAAPGDDSSTQITQTTEFLHFFEQLERTQRLALRGRHSQMDTNLQRQVLADRQVLHALLRRRPAKPSGKRKAHAFDALHAGYSAAHCHEFEAFESLVAVNNANEEKMHEMGLLVAHMGERCDHVDDFERANEEQKLRHAKAIADLKMVHSTATVELESSHEHAVAALKTTHAHMVSSLRDEIGGLHHSANEREEAFSQEKAELLTAHEAVLSAMRKSHQDHLEQHADILNRKDAEALRIQQEAALARRAVADQTNETVSLRSKLSAAEHNTEWLFAALVRVSKMAGETAALARTQKATGLIQRHLLARKLRRERSARVIQRQWLARRAAEAEKAALESAEEARRREEEAAKLSKQIETQQRLNEQLSKAGALAAEIDTKRLEEQQNKMKEIEEEARIAEQAKTALTLRRGSEGSGVDVPLRDAMVDVFGTDFVKAHIGHYLEASRKQDSRPQTKYANEVGTLIMGDPGAAALGLMKELGVEMFELFAQLAKGVDAIIEEVAIGGTEIDKECLHYVLHERAGSNPKIFPNSPHPRDCDDNGLREDRKTADGQGMLLADFVAHPDARTAQLQTAHVLAIRLYSTAAFMSLNNPLRDRKRTGPHPMAATVFFLADGIKKLRTVEADRE